ncbi:hypothetical protein F511_10630 [Dorcoceras hygrometricum]|uniref:RING-type E3 ubiquitin transferase n=1 Tax=Dorcoceras hygrometricum TaxID=472368 RepID=A0A2Z7CJN5_9LAMI|nr:hypothetical protein F511_10630 [Dorcoceras hygrometricum]
MSSIFIPDRKKSPASSAFRGLGCTSSSQVSVPEAIRTSANREAKKVKKKTRRTKKSNASKLFCNNYSAIANEGNSNSNSPSQSSFSLALSSSCVGVPDVWCGPGIGLSTDVASVDCAVSRRPPSAPARGKVDGHGVDRIVLGQRERSPCSMRRMVASDNIPVSESETAAGMSRFRSDVTGTLHRHHATHGFIGELAEIVMLQASLIVGGRPYRRDQFRDLRLDIDNMSYEELLELGDSIGYVNTGLREDEMTKCLRSSKLAVSDHLSSRFALDMERKCIICQEEYETDNKTGNLNCGHSFHIDCIKQWLVQKNACPICKAAAVSQI